MVTTNARISIVGYAEPYDRLVLMLWTTYKNMIVVTNCVYKRNCQTYLLNNCNQSLLEADINFNKTSAP